MPSKRRTIVVGVLLVIATAFVLGNQVRSSAIEQGRAEPRMRAAAVDGAMKMEGAWIARVKTSPFPSGLYQWSYILAPSNNGRSAALHGTVDVSFPGDLIPNDHESPLLGQMTQTGPTTIAFNSEWFYFLNGQVSGIGRSWGDADLIAPDKIEAHHHFEIYLGSADQDGDGIIDPGAKPVAEFLVTTIDTRLPGLMR